MNERDDYLAAARAFVDLAAQIPDDAWTAPGLGEWTVRDLVGHASRSILLVRSYAVEGELDGPPAIDDAVGYYRMALASVGDPAAVAQRGRDAAAALGDRPVDALRTLLADAAAVVAGRFHVSFQGASMRLDDYLVTRTVELVIHGDDLARAIGAAWSPPTGALRRTIDVLTGLSVVVDRGVEVMRALTGRGSLHGFTVLG